MRTEYLFILIVFVLQILSVIGQEPQITISITNIPDTIYTTLPPNSNTAEIIVLTQDVTLQANITGIWQRPNNTYTNDSTINFDVFTVAYVGLYKFYAGDVNGKVTIQIVISATGSNFAEMTSSGVYTILSDNNVFYNDRTLVCATSDTSTEPEWSRDGAVITGTWDDVTGISTLDITISQQGYYTCTPVSGTSYTVAIFNPDITIIAEEGDTYYYTKDVDPVDIQLLCTTSDPDTALDDIQWNNAPPFDQNPIILYDFPTYSTTLLCHNGTTVILTIDLLVVQGPPVITLSTTPDIKYSMSETNNADIMVLSENVMLGINLVGEWEYPNGYRAQSSPVVFDLFTANLAGVYEFYVTDWNSTDILAIQITLSAISNFAELSQGDYIILSGNNVFYNDTTLVCASSATSTEPEWSLNGAVITGIWNPITGISTQYITTLQQGYYKCSEGALFTASIFDPSITTVAKQGEEYTYSYTKGVDSSDIQLLCTNNINKAFPNMKWGSFGNPVILNHVPNQESDTFDCTFGPINILSIDLLVQGPPVITLSTTPDTIYSMLPTASDNNRANIPVLSVKVMLQTNLIGRWLKPDGSYIDGNVIEFIVFTVDLVGIYQFSVMNWEDQEEKAIQINISAVGTSIGMEADSSITTIFSNTIFYQDTITLIAATNKITLQQNDVVWSYQRSFNDNKYDIPETSNETMRSISKLNLDTKPSGYYTVSIRDDNSMIEEYIVGVFNTTNIYDTGTTKMIKYTSGVDSDKLQILCKPPNNNSGLMNIQWTNGSIYFPNPVLLEEVVTVLNSIGSLTLNCMDTNMSDLVYEVIEIRNQDPPMINITYLEDIYPFASETSNLLEITVFTPDVQLECNKDECLWSRNNSERPFENFSRESTHVIPYFTIDDGFEYILETKDSNGIYQISVEITIKPIGTAFITMTQNDSQIIYQELNNNSIINMTGNASLACATSHIPAEENDIEWFYQKTSIADPGAIRGDYNLTIGLNVLVTDQPGFYRCEVSNENREKFIYFVGIVPTSDDIQSIGRDDLETAKTIDYILGEPLMLYYYDVNIPITAIMWGIEKVGSTELEEFLNPVDVNEVFAKFGSGAYKFRCFYRQSPITNVGSLSLNMKDNASLMVESDANMTIFNDSGNENFPDPERIDIEIVSKNVLISCSLSPCRDKIEKDGNLLTTEEINIVSLRIENQGLYSLRRNTSEGVEYTTAAFNLIVTGYIEQNIINLTPRYINDTSIQISWQLLISLPDNAEETFSITYQTLNGVIQTAGITTDLNYNLTDLIPGQTYTIWVELSYTYTFVSPKLSIKVTIPAPDFPLIYVIVVVILIVIIVLLAITAVLIILLIWKLRKRKVKKFEVLETEEIPTEPNSKPSKDFGYSPVPIDNLAYNPELTESMGVKSKFKESARNSGNYQNLKEVMDPRMEPIALHLFKKAIDMLWKDETTLENEYKSLGGETLLYECGYAQLDQNRIKNKYKFIYPYDKSRVVLKKLGKAMHTDYINASNIPGVYVKENFIAAQGPKENTIKDFWRMVFELKIVNIVMVTNCVEGGKQKCEEYFPTKEGQISEFPPFKVRITNVVQSRGHITRIISIERGNEKFQVKHFHFTAWPDHDVPSLHHELLQFIGYVHENITQSDAPILVHCSAGVGRTGTFITLFNLRANILKQQPISVYHLVHEMREHRPHMVQTFRQYKFIYLAVLELLQEKTAVSAEEFMSTYQNYMESARIEESEFAKQFSELNYQCDKSFVYSSDKGEENADKNPVKDILPYDINRVMIYSPFFTCNYINATNHNDFFITTQHPCENTLRDFMQMIYETNAGLVVMLTTSKEKSKILGNLSERKAYWPHKDDTLEVPPFQVQVVNAEKTTAMIKQKISLKNVKENSEHEFLQVISATWNEKGEPIDYQCIINVVRFITVQRQKYPHSPIIIHCVDSIGKTGVVLTVYECIKEMQETGEIDIFHTVKRLRRERMKCIPHLSQFQACFTLMKQYLDY